jgi:hypothetical protein
VFLTQGFSAKIEGPSNPLYEEQPGLTLDWSQADSSTAQDLLQLSSTFRKTFVAAVVNCVFKECMDDARKGFLGLWTHISYEDLEDARFASCLFDDLRLLDDTLGALRKSGFEVKEGTANHDRKNWTIDVSWKNDLFAKEP